MPSVTPSQLQQDIAQLQKDIASGSPDVQADWDKVSADLQDLNEQYTPASPSINQLVELTNQGIDKADPTQLSNLLASVHEEMGNIAKAKDT